MEIYNDLKEKGTVDRQFNTGIKVREIDNLIMKYLRLNSTDGMLIIDLEKQSSGEKSGLKIGDVILKVNNKKVNKLKDIKNIIDENLLKESKEIIEDLIVAAHNDAKSKLKKKTSEEI